MKIIGLTGSIAMGKSTSAAMLQRMGVPVFDADKQAHHLTRNHTGIALPLIEKSFQGMVKNGILDRTLLGNYIFANPHAKKKLESILHPLISKSRAEFIKKQRRMGRKIIALDIPLLFESRLEKLCDYKLVIFCSKYLQRQRVMKRKGMNLQKYHQINRQQMNVIKKKRLADVAISSGLGRAHVFIHLQKFLNQAI